MILITPSQLDFDRPAQTKPVTVSADDDIQVASQPDWISAVNISGSLAEISTLESNELERKEGVIVFEEVGNPGSTFNLIVTKEGVTDPQSVMLKDIIDNIMVEACNEDSYMNNIKRYYALLLAKRLIQDLHYDVAKELRVYEGDITSSGKVIPPIDFVDYVRVSLVKPDGYLIPIFVNNKLNISYKYIQDNQNSIIIDREGYPIKAEGGRRTETASANTVRQFYFNEFNSIDYEYWYENAFYGVKGGQVSYTGAYRWDSDSKEFLFDNLPSEFKTVVIEYISDPILAEKDPTRLRVHKFMQSVFETGIYYKYIEKLRNVPMNEKVRARGEYYNEIRKARRRLYTKPQEIIQKLGSDVGFSKML